MGQRSKKARSTRRKLERLKMKAARRALYEGFAAKGRSRKRDAASAGNSEHINCGNPACKKCFPELHKRMASMA